MPASHAAFAAVAAALAGVDADDRLAVERFNRRQFPDYPLPRRELVADFLTGLSGMPTAAELDRLREAMELPLSELPRIEVPAWDETYGAAMQYEPAPAGPVAAAAGVTPSASRSQDHRRTGADARTVAE